MRYRPITRLPPEYAQAIALIHEYRGQRYLKRGKSVTVWSQLQPVVKSCWRIIQQFIGGRASYGRLGLADDIAVFQCNAHAMLPNNVYSQRTLKLCQLFKAITAFLAKVRQVPMSPAELRRLERQRKKKKARV